MKGQTFVLFQLYGFYVEVQYKLYRKDISMVIVSSEPEMVAPYLSQINIKGLDPGEQNKDSPGQ